MAAATAPRKTVSIYDYPEHLNPFHEEDNHNKIRFWTLGRRLNRSNSINLTGLKDLKNSWAFKSFMKKGKKQQISNKTSQENGESSPIMYRRALQYSSASRSTVGSPEKPDRYVYGGSVTPLPRSRFQERLRSTSHHEVNSLSVTPRMARSEVTGSRLSLESTNPFDEECPVPPVRASRRKKKRAPQPPGGSVTSTPDTTLDTTADSIAETTTTNVTSDLQITETEEKKTNSTDTDLELEDMNLNIELKITEDEEEKLKASKDLNKKNNNEIAEISVITNSDQTLDNEQTKTQSNADIPICNQEANRNSSSNKDIPTTFRKIDIVKYRRNSSVNEDDIRLRRGNLEDFQSLNNKRSKSLTNDLDATYATYDIDLNDNTTHVDTNGNEQPQKVVCKLYNESQRKQSIETISITEKEFIEIDRATRELEQEIKKLNSALNDEDLLQVGGRLSVSEIKKKFDSKDVSSPNPIPKPRRSHHGGGSGSP